MSQLPKLPEPDVVIRVNGEKHTVYPSQTDDALLYTADQMLAFQRDTIEACAKVAEVFGPNRPVLARQPSQVVVGRWEGEQAASKNIADAIRSMK